MTTPEPGTGRIRWEDQPEPGGAIGYVGTQDSRAFTIWPPLTDKDEWLLSCAFSNMAAERCFGSSPGELRAKAERWLAEFVVSLGAVFPGTCPVCRDTGIVWSPDPGGESAYESDCPEPRHNEPAKDAGQ